MSIEALPAPPTNEGPMYSANDRFKKLSEVVFWGSLIVATGVHFTLFKLWPEMTAEDVSFSVYELEAVELPPPPSEVRTDISAAPTFTPYTVMPGIKNRDEVRRALEREYPAALRDPGLGGVVMVWFFIDEEGRVVRPLVNSWAREDNAPAEPEPIPDHDPDRSRDG